jgi:CheY-like chemotaxis protein
MQQCGLILQGGRKMYGTILVVDDDPDLRETTRLSLSREGYEVWLAPDGNSAMELMNHPVLASAVCTVLCDLVMPNGSGMNLITYLRTYHPTVPIIVYSGTDDKGFLQGVLQEGVCDWMRKPVSRDTRYKRYGPPSISSLSGNSRTGTPSQHRHHSRRTQKSLLLESRPFGNLTTVTPSGDTELLSTYHSLLVHN